MKDSEQVYAQIDCNNGELEGRWHYHLTLADKTICDLVSEKIGLEKSVSELVKKTRYLLEWMPVCSIGSSGYLRRMAVEEAMACVEGLM